MNNLKIQFFCSLLNYKKFYNNQRIIFTMLSIIVIVFTSTSSLVKFLTSTTPSCASGNNISPCLYFTTFNEPVMQLLFTVCTTIFFANAPFADSHTLFVRIRTSSNNWIVAQFIYILSSSFIFNLIIFLTTFLATITHVEWSFGWGLVQSTPSINTTITHNYSPLFVNTIQFLLCYFLTVLVGVILSFCKIVIGNNIGFVVMSFLSFMPIFVSFFGLFAFGEWITHLSIMSFCSIQCLKEFSNNANYPTLFYAFSIVLFLIVILTSITIYSFNKKDFYIEKGD